ncbi:MAG: stage II sporulation protein P [Ruminococcus sp.]|nr:stage II sporulation protein P [Ruminococcus sp.]
MKNQNRKTAASAIALTVLMALCLSMVAYRAQVCMALEDEAALLTGRLSFINGTADGTENPSTSDEQPSVQTPARPLAETPTAQSPEKPQDNTHEGDSYPVKELLVSNGNMSYENITIRNTTDVELDAASLLSSELPFSLDDNHEVQVLVYHTHTCERYLTEDTGEYYEDYYPRSTDGELGVMAVGERLVETLKERGIGAVHDTTLHDYPSYEGSYARSWETICKYKEKYPSIKVTIDLHRDAMTTDEGVKYKPTFEHDGEKAAQIMIMAGCDSDGGFDFWDENLIFAMQLQKKCEDLYPDMTRPLNFGEYTYNMNFNNGSLLIEVGTDANTVDEACRSGAYLGEAMADLLRS